MNSEVIAGIFLGMLGPPVCGIAAGFELAIRLDDKDAGTWARENLVRVAEETVAKAKQV